MRVFLTVLLSAIWAMVARGAFAPMVLGSRPGFTFVFKSAAVPAEEVVIDVDCTVEECERPESEDANGEFPVNSGNPERAEAE
ncbi:hypothetical protein ACA910_014663 [Epithemia clementina (nom. ined.)]